MTRTTLLAATWGIILLFGADHASAEDPSSPFLKLCEADGNAAGASTADGPTEPETEKKGQAKPMRDHDMQWDFWTLSPESAHQVTWLMGDRGIPKSWRQMNGYSSHTYMWVNAKGQKFWVKYHFKTDQGIDFLTQADADRLAGVTLPVDIYSWTTMWPDSLSRYACSSCDDHWPCSGFTEHRDAQHTN